MHDWYLHRSQAMQKRKSEACSSFTSHRLSTISLASPRSLVRVCLAVHATPSSTLLSLINKSRRLVRPKPQAQPISLQHYRTNTTLTDSSKAYTQRNHVPSLHPNLRSRFFWALAQTPRVLNRGPQVPLDLHPFRARAHRSQRQEGHQQRRQTRLQ